MTARTTALLVSCLLIGGAAARAGEPVRLERKLAVGARTKVEERRTSVLQFTWKGPRARNHTVPRLAPLRRGG